MLCFIPWFFKLSKVSLKYLDMLQYGTITDNVKIIGHHSC